MPADLDAIERRMTYAGGLSAYISPYDYRALMAEAREGQRLRGVVAEIDLAFHQSDTTWIQVILHAEANRALATLSTDEIMG